jgi:MOSC domain-containing protein YiiM
VPEVSEPRIPCFKLVMRMQAGSDFSERFLRSGRVGACCRVIEEGPVAPGDYVEIIARGPTSPTVRDHPAWTHAPDRRLDQLRAPCEGPVREPADGRIPRCVTRKGVACVLDL